MSHTGFWCIACNSQALTTSGESDRGRLVCPGCDAAFPLLRGRVPVIVADPAELCAEVGLQLATTRWVLRDQIADHAKAIELGSARTATLERCLSGLKVNEALMAALQNDATSCVETDRLVMAAVRRDDAADPLPAG